VAAVVDAIGFVDQFAEIGKPAIDAGEADVGDLVDLAELLGDQSSDSLAADLAVILPEDRVLHGVDQLGQ